MGIEAIRTLGLPGLLHIAPIGGSETLYRARQLSKDRMVALRFLDWDTDTNGCADSAVVVRALQTLSQHPHVVTVYGSGQAPNGPVYLLLELLQNGSLGEWVAADGRLPCAEVLEVAVKIGGALETAHLAGVVHGRLVPESILVSPSGEPQLAGLDRALLRRIHGLRGGLPPAPADDDVTALAMTMFTLLTAAVPTDEPVRDVLERCEVPAVVRGLLERCLATNHAFRPASIRELTAAIQQVQQVLGLPITSAVVDKRAAEGTAQAIQEATALPPVEIEPELEVAEPEPAESKPEPGRETPDPELEAAESVPVELEFEPDAAEPEPEAAEPEPVPEPPEPEPRFSSTPPEAGEPEPKVWPAVMKSTRSARQRWRRVVTVAVLALLGAAVAVAGVFLFRRGHDAGAAVDQPPPVVVEEQPASNRDATYKGFRTVTDESGQLSMIVPEEWSAIRSSPWIVNGENVGNRLEAALEGPAARKPWSRPFAVLAASQTLGTARTVDQVLDQLRILSGECTYTGRTPFNDNLYAGAIDSYVRCGQSGASIEILVAASKEPSRLVMVQIARLGPRDENARDRVMETFHVTK